MSKKNDQNQRLKTPEEQSAESLRRARPAGKKRKKDILQHQKAKKKKGRPTKLVEETVRKLEAAFCNDFTIEEAVDYAEITRQTYYVWLKQSKEFSDRMSRAQQYPLTLAKKAMIGQIKGSALHRPDGNLGLRFLERRQPDRYKPRIDPEDIVIPPITVVIPGDRKHPRFTPKK